ncbi:class I SAM-dependent methyltransferase [Trujillonella humicola]|uniref:class I SAM-dependent methyltransferase n=1 Tax=Trujillonella humicola TaxID=3383699 RepID=UPI0039062C57
MTTDAVWVEDMPALYDRLLAPALFEPFAGELAGRAAALAPSGVVEVAAGTGVVTRALCATLPAARVVATDLNPAMAARGAAGVPAARWAVADAQALPVAGGVADLVVCSFAAMFFPDRRAAFAETARVLSPAGTALYSIWDDVERSTFPAALVRALGTVLPQDPPDFVVRVPHGYADVDRIAADLAAGGLAGDVETVQLTAETPSVTALAEGFCLGTPLRAVLARRGSLPDLVAAVAGAMTAELGDGPVRGALTAHLVTARRA